MVPISSRRALMASGTCQGPVLLARQGLPQEGDLVLYVRPVT